MKRFFKTVFMKGGMNFPSNLNTTRALSPNKFFKSRALISAFKHKITTVHTELPALFCLLNSVAQIGK